MGTVPAIFTLLLCFALNAQGDAHKSVGAVNYPDIPDYVTLPTDLHQHTVFSDGNV